MSVREGEGKRENEREKMKEVREGMDQKEFWRESTYKERERGRGRERVCVCTDKR